MSMAQQAGHTSFYDEKGASVLFYAMNIKAIFDSYSMAGFLEFNLSYQL
ncbi:hypothetical protein H0A67_06610 [Pusillimonas noertemannii]|nr:hypothetical protein [Pusillimonas noertemannii]NYT68241.1 hypothetical protein [Pusillimonas noertemannii]